MEMKANSSQVLMSDTLRGNVAGLDEDVEATIEREQSKFVVVIAERVEEGSSETIVGILRGLLVGPTIELEFRTSLEIAMAIVGNDKVSFKRFELHHGLTIVPLRGPFKIKATRVDEISSADQMCTLGLHLEMNA